ncbi:hypothetical protein B0T18DRAFT_149639 [Schizothecium vesticola]|uniref:Uncharacterized protein n=1 Tax=Schizothecium vesticola TaxID=314040 RepID=A0AA40K553_9PEZI|nr:hypothetical protein B0T18DRAFT_149639 [Schizothecium vesticola]
MTAFIVRPGMAPGEICEPRLCNPYGHGWRVEPDQRVGISYHKWGTTSSAWCPSTAFLGGYHSQEITGSKVSGQGAALMCLPLGLTGSVGIGRMCAPRFRTSYEP